MPLDMKTMSNWAGKCQVGFGMEMCLNNAQKQPPKNFLKISQYSQENNCAGVCF